MALSERNWKSILIAPRFQLKLLSYFGAVFVVTTATLYSTTFLFFWNLKEKGLRVGIPSGHVYYDFLQNQKKDLDLLFLGLAILNFLILLTVGFIVSHRMAGPLHKIKLFLQDPDSQHPLKLRQKDFFKDLADLVNAFKDKMK